MQQAKIAVAGATGRLGRHVVDVLSAAGHEVVPISRSVGVDVITGDGFAEALKDARAIIDVTAGRSSEQRAATGFFTTAARNLQQAGERAGVARYVAVSIIGIQKAAGGYGSAKLAHEQAVLAGPVPARILRVAQFHELVGVLMETGRQGDVIYLPEMRTQIIAARAPSPRPSPRWPPAPQAEFAAARAAESAGAPIPELAGPLEENFASLARLVAARRGDQVRIEEVEAAEPDSEAAADGCLLPGPHAELAPRPSRNGSPPSQTSAAQRKHRAAGSRALGVVRQDADQRDGDRAVRLPRSCARHMKTASHPAACTSRTG